MTSPMTIYRISSLGYAQFTSVSASSAIVIGTTAPAAGVTAIPSFTNSLLIFVEGQGIRWRDDGTAPTSSVGMPVAAGQAFSYQGIPGNLQIIGQTAGGTVNVMYQG